MVPRHVTSVTSAWWSDSVAPMGWFRRWRDRGGLRTSGWAEVVEAWKKPVDMTQQNCKMKLRLVDVPGVDPATVVDHHEWTVRLNRWPEVGMRVAVTVEVGAEVHLVDVDWDSVFGEVLGGKLGVAAEYLGTAAGMDLDLSRGIDQSPPAEEVQAQFMELNRRHAAGEITYEQMAEEMKRIVGFDA